MIFIVAQKRIIVKTQICLLNEYIILYKSITDRISDVSCPWNGQFLTSH